jgi:hypothetical protein
MKKMSNLLTVAVASSCLLFGATAMAAGHTKDPLVFSGSSYKKVNLLFTIELKSAKLTHIKDQKYKLSFKPSDAVDGVLAFSDRPNRIATRMSYADHVKTVTTGKNSFVKDKPNLVLSWGGVKQPPVAFKVTEASHGNDLSLLTLQVLNTGKNTQTPIAAGTFKDVQLFIDATSQDDDQPSLWDDIVALGQRFLTVAMFF